MLLGGQGTVCVNQPVKPKDLRNVCNSLHREVRGHRLFLMNVFAHGLVVFKGKKKTKQICYSVFWKSSRELASCRSN